MKFYRVENGPVRIGPEHEVLLSGEQYRRREDRMVMVEERDGAVLAKPKSTSLDFKTGEIVGMSADPLKQFAENFVAVTDQEAKKAWSEIAEADAARARTAREAGDLRRAAARKAIEARLAKEKVKADMAVANMKPALEKPPLERPLRSEREQLQGPAKRPDSR